MVWGPWVQRKLAAGLCTCCGREPLRKSKSGKSRLCEACHARQVARMWERKVAGKT